MQKNNLTIFFGIFLVSMLFVPPSIPFMVPSAFGGGFQIYVHESSFPFSIKYPSDWFVNDEDSYGGIRIDDNDSPSDNAMLIEVAPAEFRDNDFQTWEYFMENTEIYGTSCKLRNMQDNNEAVYRMCMKGIIDEFGYEHDGYVAHTVVFSYDVMIESMPPRQYAGMGTNTYILNNHDLWIISTTNTVEQFDFDIIQQMLSSFKINNIESTVGAKISGIVIEPFYIIIAVVVIGGIIGAIAVAKRGSKTPKPVKQKHVEKEETSAFCESCGNTLKPEAKFCGSCGNQV